MDLTISLAHFCDNHGPTSILCTQALPLSCFACQPRSIGSSFDDLESAAQTAALHAQYKESESPKLRKDESFDFGDVHDSSQAHENTLSRKDSSSSRASHAQQSRGNGDGERKRSRPQSTLSSYGGGSSASECVNCAINIPQRVTSQSSGATSPGSPPSSLSGSCSPTLRSKVPIRVYLDDGYDSTSHTNGINSANRSRGMNTMNTSAASSYPSAFDVDASDTDSTASSTSYAQPTTIPNSYTTNSSRHRHLQYINRPFHSHTATYLTTHTPQSTPRNPQIYTRLRLAIVRTLSGEVLPRGQTSGPLFFGSPADGYVIAYTFRLPDQFARGGQRLYSLVMLAGSDARRAFGITAAVWRAMEDVVCWLRDKVDDAIAADLSMSAENDEVSLVHDEASQISSRTFSSPELAHQQHQWNAGTAFTKQSIHAMNSKSPSDKSEPRSFLTGGKPNNVLPSIRPGMPQRIPSHSSSSNFSIREGSNAWTETGSGSHAKANSLAAIGLKGRGLVEMTGDAQIFARLHVRFVEILQADGL